VVFDVDFRVLTALKGWVGQAAKRTGALHKKTSLKKKPLSTSQNVFIRPNSPKTAIEKRFYPKFNRKRR